MLRNYIVLSWKILCRRKFFTFISLFGIALTLVVLMLVTALVDQTFGPIAPEVHADRVLGVYSIGLESEGHSFRGSPGYRFLDRHVRTLPDVEAVTIISEKQEMISFSGGQRLPLSLKRTDGSFWRVLKFDFLEGGPYTDHDDAEANPVAVISRQTRHRLFGPADPDNRAVGRSFEVDGQRFRVVGVVADVSIFRVFPHADVWVPLGTAKSDAWRHSMRGGFRAQILARHKADLPRVRADYVARLASVDVAQEFGRLERLEGAAETQFEALARNLMNSSFDSGAAARLRLVLLLAALLFMTLPSLNMININVSRILERASEIGVRKSFGASSRTLVGQFVVENLLLSLLGGAVGFVLTLGALWAISGTQWVSYAEITMNARVFVYGLAFTVVFGLLSGCYPAWKMSRLHPVEALRESAS